MSVEEKQPSAAASSSFINILALEGERLEQARAWLNEAQERIEIIRQWCEEPELERPVLRLLNPGHVLEGEVVSDGAEDSVTPRPNND